MSAVCLPSRGSLFLAQSFVDQHLQIRLISQTLTLGEGACSRDIFRTEAYRRCRGKAFLRDGTAPQRSIRGCLVKFLGDQVLMIRPPTCFVRFSLEGFIYYQFRHSLCAPCISDARFGSQGRLLLHAACRVSMSSRPSGFYPRRFRRPVRNVPQDFLSALEDLSDRLTLPALPLMATHCAQPNALYWHRPIQIQAFCILLAKEFDIRHKTPR